MVDMEGKVTKRIELGGTPADWDLLAIQAASADRPQACRIAMLNPDWDRLLLATWTPGAGFETSYLALENKLEEEIGGVAFLDHRLIVCTRTWMLGVNCNTGSVSRIMPNPNACALDPFGAELITATDYGLLTTRFWGGPEDPVAPGTFEPVYAGRMDPSDMLAMAGDDEEHFKLVIASNGYLTVATIEKPAFNYHCKFVGSKYVDTPMPYDEIEMPKLYLPGPMAYAMDECGTGAIAFDARNDAVIFFPREKPYGYAFVQEIKPSLDASACLVRTRDGWFHWVPGTVPDPVELAHDQMLLWQGDRALVLDTESASLCDIAFAHS